MKLSVSKGLGVATSYQAECFGILEAVEIAVGERMVGFIVECYSQATVETFQKGTIPLMLKARWRQCLKKIHRSLKQPRRVPRRLPMK
ncbi:hypothetical protein FRX31_027700, partial [Thalictrum thalictroides]